MASMALPKKIIRRLNYKKALPQLPQQQRLFSYPHSESRFFLGS